MTEVAKRAYRSEVRSSAARETRRSVVAAARDLFVARGYAATTIDAVAVGAGVSRKTVTSIGGKGMLLKLAWDWALVGDDEPVPMADRQRVQAILLERDPRRLVRMWVEMITDAATRSAPVGRALLSAADADEEAADLLAAIRRESHAGATAFVEHLASVGGLRPGLDPTRGADACWSLVNSVLYDLLVLDRGWSPADYEDWLVTVVSATLLE
jgi:AcrR family transcriptional regulator